MKKINFLALLTLLASMLITSCSSDDSSSDVSTEVASDSYWPLAINNQWVYTENGEPYTVKITGTDTFDGTTYYSITEKNEYNLQIWVAKKDNTYFLKTGALDITEGDINIKMDSYELPVLKDNLANNGQWNGTATVKVTYKTGTESASIDMTIKCLGVILDKDATVTVNNKVYTNVINMSLRQEVSIAGESTITESLYWYAKGIGPIKSINTVDGSTVESILVSYIVN
ncbi:MAG TPA: hypothetical protein VIH09_04130 [Flavobacterium sp.]|uniref:hypothetical protein n=1 Tax=Flavobacterium sp. TaxID=239 RepID=UPI002F3EDE15